ncbi:radical SAM protein [bacterium]|nr:radical SAM protein [bacterium]
MNWPIVPLSKGQLLDVNPKDILENGLYRKCDTYKGGGGYDQFPLICKKRLGTEAHQQFVVQLKGCNLDCPYCYVTREGVWGDPIRKTNEELSAAFLESGQEVFHLMGGAPALRLPFWGDLMHEVFKTKGDAIFHSDLMLTERPYDYRDLRNICYPRAIFAVNIKGLTDKEYFENTRKEIDWELFWRNFSLISTMGVPYYITFTGCNDEKGMVEFLNEIISRGITYDPKQAYHIDLIEYEAVKFVDEVSWGSKK